MDSNFRNIPKTNITLKNLRMKFRNKKHIIDFFVSQSKNYNCNSKDLVFPDYDFYDFQYFVQVLTDKKGVTLLIKMFSY